MKTRADSIDSKFDVFKYLKSVSYDLNHFNDCDIHFLNPRSPLVTSMDWAPTAIPSAPVGGGSHGKYSSAGSRNSRKTMATDTAQLSVGGDWDGDPGQHRMITWRSKGDLKMMKFVLFYKKKN